MRAPTPLLALAMACLSGLPLQAEALTLYDDFSLGHLSRSKWQPSTICNTKALECAREVKQGALRLAIQASSEGGSDSGLTQDGVGLVFPDPQTIKTISFQFTVQSFTAQACATSAEVAHPQLLLSGSYFNSGSGTSSGDVQAYLTVQRASNDTWHPPGTLQVGAFMSIGGVFFNNVDMGTVRPGEKATGTLRWEKSSKQFVATIKRNQTLPAVVEVAMPYTQSDTLPPVFASRSLRLNSYTPNCTTAPSVTAMDVKVDNITRD